MDIKLKRINKIFPWYWALSGDLLFFIAIMTIWLTEVKGFTEQQFILLTTIASLFTILFQIPLIKIIKKIGNTRSTRIGMFFLVIHMIILTFAQEYIFFVFAFMLAQIGWIFKQVDVVLLKNNLSYQGKDKKFVEIISTGNVIYSIVTAVTALIIGVLFGIHTYLPMILAILNMLLCFGISFYLIDITDTKEYKAAPEEKSRANKLPKPLMLAVLVLSTFGVYTGFVTFGHQGGQLLAQNELVANFSLTQATLYMGFLLFVSRLLRIFSNAMYPRVYNKLGDKVGIIFAVLLVVAMSLMVIGFYINATLIVKIALITIGFSLLPAIWDPFDLFIQNICLTKFDKVYHQELISYLHYSRKVFALIFGSIVALMLISLPMIYVIIALFIGSIPIVYIFLKLKYLLQK